MFGIGVPELMVILVIALVVLGPSRLPEVAKALGKALGEFRKATSDISDEIKDVRRTLEQEARSTEREFQRNKAKGNVARRGETADAQAKESETKETEASES